MKKIILLLFLSLTCNLYGQLYDDYNTSADLVYTTEGTWIVNLDKYEGQTGSATTPEHSYVSYDITGSISGWNLANYNVNEWIGWMDLNRTSASGWGANNYSCGLVLAANAADFNAGTTVGYAIGLKSDGILTLFKFSTGISSGTASLPTGSTEIIATSYSYLDSDNGINIYVKLGTDGKWTVKWKAGTALSLNDAVDNSKYDGGSITSSSVDETYRGTIYKYAGWIYAHSSGASEKSFFDNFGFSQNGALPVELTSFRLSVVDKTVNLIWRTATEVNNYGFEVERSQTSNVKSETWEKIGFVNGNGNSNSPKSYSFSDEPYGGEEFKYRLKQIDFDGKFEYTDEVTAVFEDVTTFELEQNYPNPFNPSTKISYTIPQRSNVKLRVYNMLAQMEAELVNESQEAGHYQVIFNGSNLPSGTYFYKLEAGKFVEVKKFLLVK